MQSETIQTATAQPGLHFTIGTHPASGLDLSQDLRLLKAALLYADHVKLYSPVYSMLTIATRVKDIPPRQQLQVIEMVVPYLRPEEEARELLRGLAKIEAFRRRKHLGHRETVLRLRIEREMAKQWDLVRGVANEMLTTAGADEIDRAASSGLVELHTFEGTEDDQFAFDFFTDCIARASGSPLYSQRSEAASQRDNTIIREYVAHLCKAVVGGHTNPLFDAEAGDLIDSILKAARIHVSDVAVDRGKHSGLAAHLLQRLPSFEEASVQELFHIRRELEKPLIKFRAAILRFTGKIRSAQWDVDFPSEAEAVFLRDVAPAIEEIEQSIKTNSALTTFLDKLVDKGGVFAKGSIVSILLAQLPLLPAALTFALGLATSLAFTIYATHREMEGNEHEIERNELFFYHQAGQYLSERR